MEEGESIEAQVQRELDALSLDELNLDDDVYNTNEETAEEKSEVHDEKATLLYLAKSSARSKRSHMIIEEAEQLLSKCTTSNHAAGFPENSLKHIPVITFDILPMLYDKTALISDKTTDEIEEDNRAKEEELEHHLKSDEEKVNIEIRQAKDIENEELEKWQSREEKMAKSVKIMLEKADYWEKTYEDVAHDELARKQKDLEDEYHNSHKRILEMENKERKFLEDLLHEQKTLETEKRENAAIKIQRNVRGYLVRKTHGDEVKMKMAQARSIVTAKKIAAIEEQRRKDKVQREEKKVNFETHNMKSNNSKEIINNENLIIKSKEPSEVDQDDNDNINDVQSSEDDISSLDRDKEENDDKTIDDIKANGYPNTETRRHNNDQHVRTNVRESRDIAISDNVCNSSKDGYTGNTHRNDHQYFDDGNEDSAVAAIPENHFETSTNRLPSSDELTQRHDGVVESRNLSVKSDRPICNATPLSKDLSASSNTEEVTIQTTLNLTEETQNVAGQIITTTENHTIDVSNNVIPDTGSSVSPSAALSNAIVLIGKSPPSRKEASPSSYADSTDISCTENAQNITTESPRENLVEAETSHNLSTGTKSLNGKIASELSPCEIIHPLISKQSQDLQNCVNKTVSNQLLSDMQLYDCEKISTEHEENRHESTGNSSPYISKAVKESKVTVDSVQKSHSDGQNLNVTSKTVSENIVSVSSDKCKTKDTMVMVCNDSGSPNLSDPSSSKTIDQNLVDETVSNQEGMEWQSMEETVLPVTKEIVASLHEKAEFEGEIQRIDSNSLTKVILNQENVVSLHAATEQKSKILHVDSDSVTKELSSQERVASLHEAAEKQNLKIQLVDSDSVTKEISSQESMASPNETQEQNREIQHVYYSSLTRKIETQLTDANKSLPKADFGRAELTDDTTVDISERMKFKQSNVQDICDDYSISTNQNEQNLDMRTNELLDSTSDLTVISKLDDHSDTECLYESQFYEQHKAWSQRMQKSVEAKEKQESPGTRIGRRKMIRASSAAKKLSSFTDDEILEGAFTLSDCDLTTKTTDVNETRCIVLMNGSGGRNLNCVSKYVGLSHLLVKNCGLLSLESLHNCQNLKYISAPNNSINFISCSGMKQLEYVDLSHNRLTSIHGFDQCKNLLFLDLSHNSITKISGLEDTSILAHVRLAENQLLSVSGLSRCGHLMYLDVTDNHLTNLDSLSDNKYLVSLDAAGNYIEYLDEKFLDCCTLLIKLNASRNSLPSLGMNDKTWLPSLIDIQVTSNRIGCDPSQQLQNFALSCPFLSRLDLRQNLLPDLDSLKSLRNCQCLNHVDVTDNPILTTGTDDQNFLKSMPEILTKKQYHSDQNSQNLFENYPDEKFLVLKLLANDFTNLLTKSSTCDSQNIIEVASMYLHKVQIESKRHMHKVRKALLRCGSNHEDFKTKKVIPPTLFTLQCNHLKKMIQITSDCRSIFDTFEKDEKMHQDTDSKQSKRMLNPPACPPTNRPNLVENILVASQEECAQDCEQSSAIMTKSIAQISSPPMASPTKSNRISRNFAVYKRLRTSVKSVALETDAAKKLQAYWRGYRVRKRHASVKSARKSAAVMIQALWRGYNTRRKYQQAMRMVKEHEEIGGMDDDDELEDVDLDGFNFDEKLFDEQWAYPVTGELNRSGESIKKLSQSSPRFDHQPEYQRPGNPETMSFSSSKPPLPPISPANDARSVLSATNSEIIGNYPMNSSRSRTSSKQDVLSNEWGIKSSSTADLMIKRARRMKGAKRKTRTAEEKLLKFQEKVSAFQGADIVTSRRQSPNKVDYFRAREEGFHQKDYIPSAEDEKKMNYTYEWLHKQVGTHYNESRKSNTKKTNSSDASRSTSGIFPTIPRSPSLVGAQDLEVVSLTSGSNFSERSKDRLRDIARRHNPHLTHNMK